MNQIQTDFRTFVESPDALFHYTKTSIALEKILFDKQFKLFLFKDSNDPREYEFILNFFGSGSGEHDKQHVLKLLEEVN